MSDIERTVEEVLSFVEDNIKRLNDGLRKVESRSKPPDVKIVPYLKAMRSAYQEVKDFITGDKEF